MVPRLPRYPVCVNGTGEFYKRLEIDCAEQTNLASEGWNPQQLCQLEDRFPGLQALPKGVICARFSTLSLVAGSQHLFEIRGAIMGVVVEGKDAGEAL